MLKDPSICITADQDDVENNLAIHAKAISSSDIGDSAHIPIRAIDGSVDSFWASKPGEPTATFEVKFE